MTNYQKIIESCGAEYLRTTGDGTVIFRSAAGVELRIFDCACTPENVRLRLDMTRKFPAGRRDELADSIRITRSQISDLQHELQCSRRDAVERDQGTTPADIAASNAGLFLYSTDDIYVTAKNIHGIDTTMPLVDPSDRFYQVPRCI